MSFLDLFLKGSPSFKICLRKAPAIRLDLILKGVYAVNVRDACSCLDSPNIFGRHFIHLLSRRTKPVSRIGHG
jgi:hypothetical protein